MLSDSISQSNSIQNNLTQLEHKKSITKVIEYIKMKLPDFISIAKMEGIRVEKGLNHLFVRIMDDHKLFQFMHEDIEHPISGNSATIDIGIYTKGDSSTRFFAIEAKRLDTSISNYNRRKKEYIANNNQGGIERFKKEIHAKELLCAGMLGYVQSDNFNTWHNRINNYINEEINGSTIGVVWNSNELLQIEKIDTVYATYISKHLRISGNEIYLYHIWIKLE